MRVQFVFRYLFILAIFGTVLATFLGGAVFWYFAQNLPGIYTLQDYRPLLVTQIVGQGEGDQLLGEFYKERRYVVSYDQIPEHVVNAFVSSEDDQFFRHQGINLASILRATIANLKAGHVVQGGSTITQQVAKSLLLTPERSFVRKIREVILAYRMEKNLSKQQILSLYLNQIYLGNGAYGVEAASRIYFGKNVPLLSVSEAAMLAGMPQAPSSYNPFQNPKRAKERQKYVLRRMYENGLLSQSDMEKAAAEPVRLFYKSEINEKFAPFYVEHIRRFLLERFGEKMTYEDGLVVQVPTSRKTSLAAAQSVQEGLREVDKRLGWRGPIKRVKPSDLNVFYEKSLVDSLMERYGYLVLKSDGSLDPKGAVELEKIAHEDFLVPGKLYPAVVMDAKGATASVRVGPLTFELPASEMEWAFRGIKKVESLIHKGDVIWIRHLAGKTVTLEQKPELQAALLSIEAKTGQVIAMVGGYDFSESEFNRAVQAQRQPGSAFKPFIYTKAIESGYTPASIIVDSPIVFEDSEFGKWKPANFEEKFYGDTTLRNSLIRSRNIPTIKILQAVSLGKLFELVGRIGFKAALPQDYSVSLGSGSTTLLDLATAYAVYPRLGRKVEPIFFSKIMDREGNILLENKIEEFRARLTVPQPSPTPSDEPLGLTEVAPSPTPRPSRGTELLGRADLTLPQYPLPDDPNQVLDPRVSYVMTHLMNEVVMFGTGAGAKGLGRATAGKTGTSNDFTDAWFMGFTPELVTGAWVGFDQQRSIGSGETGARAALPIWLGFMQKAVTDYTQQEFIIPPGVVFVSVNPATGKRVPPNASGALKEVFIEGTEPGMPGSTVSPETGEKIESKPKEDAGKLFREDF